MSVVGILTKQTTENIEMIPPLRLPTSFSIKGFCN